ncbi:MAG: glycosyltransferase [Deltaproteobacteria bacterium]|jgi:spore maturation protein CgeB|nr:glycosyltransferase [Deltaproteobacteria bacterium]
MSIFRRDAVFSQSTLARNMAVLRRSCPGAAKWLDETKGATVVTLGRAEDGNPVMMVGGKSQETRRGRVFAEGTNPPTTPFETVADMVEEIVFPEGLRPNFSSGTRPLGVCLFGLGGLGALKTALLFSLFEARPRGALAYEPDVEVARALLSLYDLTTVLADGRLVLVSPRELAEGLEKPDVPFALTCAAAKRRHPDAWSGFIGLAGNPERQRKPRPPLDRVLIIPPYSGGSEPMGKFLSDAAARLGVGARLLDWPGELRDMAGILRDGPGQNRAKARGQGGSPSARAPGGGQINLRRLFQKSAEHACETVKDFGPTVVLVLAQAPLDAAGLARVRAACEALDGGPARMAFWFVEDIMRFGYVREVARAYDLFLHIQKGLADDFARSLGVRGANYLPSAADESVFFPRKVPERFRSTVSLCGAGYPNRRSIMSGLIRDLPSLKPGGVGGGENTLTIFGSGWEGCPPELAPYLFEGGRRLDTRECALAYAGSQVSLNIHSGDGDGFDAGSAFVNPRTFELAASGTLQIVDRRPLLDGLFGSDELVVADNPGDLPGLIKQCLADPKKGRDMAARARERVLGEHLYTRRLETVLKLAGEDWPIPRSEDF